MTKVELYKSRVFETIIHLSALGLLGYGLYFMKFQARYKSKSIRLSHLVQTSTFGFWCLIVQAVYYTIALLNDLFGDNEIAPKRTPLIRKVKDYVFAAFAFPLANSVGISFWAIYAIDRELVFPRILDSVFPNWLNHVVHTCVVVFIMLELFTSHRNYPTGKKGIAGLGLFMLAYLIWLHIVRYYSGAWVYPILEELSPFYRNLFLLFVLLYTWFLYFAGEKLSGFVWRKELKTVKVATRKNK